jgi:hypothetical protein
VAGRPAGGRPATRSSIPANASEARNPKMTPEVFEKASDLYQHYRK